MLSLLHLRCTAGTSSAYAHVVSDPCSNTLSPPPPMAAPPPVIGPKVFFTSSLPDQSVDSFDDIQQSIFLGLAGQYAQGELRFPLRLILVCASLLSWHFFKEHEQLLDVAFD